MIAAPPPSRRRHRPRSERQRLEALDLLERAAFAYRVRLRLTSSPLRCMTDSEWSTYVQGRRVAPLELARRACADCPIEYMAEQQRLGRCNPPPGAETPALRLQGGRYGVDEPLRRRLPRGREQRRQRRSWAA